MTFKEFKELIEMTGEYYVEKLTSFSSYQNMIYVSDADGNTMCKFWGDCELALNTIYMDNDDFLKQYTNTIFEFAKTPVKERYPIKKYYVKLDLPEKFSNKQQYLNKMIMSDGIVRYFWDEKKKEPSNYISPLEIGVIYQTQFTMEEIEEIIPEKDRNKFKIVPVEEDE